MKHSKVRKGQCVIDCLASKYQRKRLKCQKIIKISNEGGGRQSV